MGGDLWGEIEETQRLLGVALSESKRRGAAMVAAEAAYYTAKAEAVFRLKGDGMPATLINAVIKGEAGVVDEMRAYHAAQVEYDNSREAINVYKKRLDTLREQYAREWGAAGRQ